MFINAEPEKPKEPQPLGMHTLVLFSIVDFGTQSIDYNNGEPPKIEHRIRLDWEYSEEKMLDGRPFAIGLELKASLHEKSNLYALINDWQQVDPHANGGFDIAKLLGKAGNGNIAPNKKGNPKLMTVAPLKKSEKAPTPINPLRIFDLNNYKASVFESLPAWMKDKIKQSPEYIELMSGGNKPDPKIPADVTTETPFENI